MMVIHTWKTIFKYRNLIYGLAAIWIVLYHIHLKYPLGVPVLSPLLKLGNMGVDIFLLLSAVGLSYSIEKNDTKTFYKNRLKRTFITYLLIAGPFILWKYFIAQSITLMTVPNFLSELSTLSYFWTKEGTYPFWYIPCILLFYALYPLLYRIYKKNKLYIVGLIIVSVIAEILLVLVGSPIITVTERTFSRIPIFLTGILLSDYVKKEKKISLPWVIVSFLVLAITMVIYPATNFYKYNVIIVRYLYGVMSVFLIIAGAFVMELIKKFKITDIFIKIFSVLGGISLEIYVVHVAIIRVLTHYNLHHLVHWSVYYAGILISAIILALGFSKLSNKIIRKHQEKRLRV
jgi:peptidoglycan/LPS O-acetylase OafA/YrhL